MTLQVKTFDELESTNDYLKSHPELWENDFYTVRAISQTGGRGRQEKKWFSSDKLDLTFSTIFQSPLQSDSAAITTLYAGLAVYRTLKEYLGDGLYIKWPNDIFYNGKKICGILSESILSNNKCIIVVGIGVNINNVEFPSGLKEISTSMKKIKGCDFNIEIILENIMKNIIEIVPQINNPIKKETMEELRKSFRHEGQEIAYYFNGHTKKGKVLDINGNGNIIISDKESGDPIIYNGELTYI